VWRLSFLLREYLRGNLWFLPLLGGLAGTGLGIACVQLDEAVTVPSFWQYSSSTATAVLSAIVAANAALTGFVVTVSVLVVQMATGTFSARYMRLWYRDRMLKAVLAVLVGTLSFSFALLRSVEEDFVPNIGVTIAAALVVVGLLLFLLFLNRFIHRLRPVAVASLVGKAARRHFQTMHAGASPASDASAASLGEPGFVVHSRRAGAIQAVNVSGLRRWAHEHDCVLVLVHPVGSFVSVGSILVEVHGGDADPVAAERELGRKVALGMERTIEQDPAFGLRIMVDVANKALSPAVNDPTTAVQVIDYLEDVLRLIGATDLSRRAEHRDEQGRPRVIVPTHDWVDYLALGVTEIRGYGGSAIQVVRRLRAMLEALDGSVRPEHRPAVAEELARLDATVDRTFAVSADRDRAGMADRQGLGGPKAH
jgi:uncharacterized membrane protein